jgi:hypothetical protein
MNRQSQPVSQANTGFMILSAAINMQLSCLSEEDRGDVDLRHLHVGLKILTA